jgi:dolichyl-phosphate-mannose--protein O-mannosyl transferase
MIPMILLGCAIFWLVMNVLWIVLLVVRKKRQLSIPKEIAFHIKKTMKFNVAYAVVFAILGFLFL